jgi:type I restriction enzyme S subunit
VNNPSEPVSVVLPQGWCSAKLGEVADLVSGAGFPLKFQGRTGLTYPFFKVGNLGDVNSVQSLKDAPDTIDYAIARELRARIIPPESVLFAKIGMAIGLNRRRLTEVACCIDNNMMAAIPKSCVLPHYLMRFLETIDLMPLTQATTVPSLRKVDLEEIEFPLAPLAEQKRIVGKIEELLARINATRERLAKVPAILKRFRQAVLAAACSGRLTEDWRTTNGHAHDARQLISLIERVRRVCSQNIKSEKKI